MSDYCKVNLTSAREIQLGLRFAYTICVSIPYRKIVVRLSRLVMMSCPVCERGTARRLHDYCSWSNTGHRRHCPAVRDYEYIMSIFNIVRCTHSIHSVALVIARLRSVSTIPEFTARVHGDARVPRPVYTGVRFPLPELTARVDGCQKMHPSSRAVNSARELGP